VDIGDILRVLFYLWLFAALGYWVYRGYNRFIRGSADDLAERATVGTPDDAASASDRDAAPKAPARRTMREVLDEQQAAKAPGPTVVPGQLVNSVIKEEIAAKKARASAETGADDETRDADAAVTEATADTAPTSERRGLFAPASDAEPAAERAPVSALLEGMVMPCDLVPLINVDVVPSPHHVVFVTTGHAPAEIGSSLGDELERLGFTLRSETDNEVVATRDGASLRVILHPDAATERVDGALRYPSIPGGSTAVEFRS
jgi:hypothetical protein